MTQLESENLELKKRMQTLGQKLAKLERILRELAS